MSGESAVSVSFACYLSVELQRPPQGGVPVRIRFSGTRRLDPGRCGEGRSSL